MDTEMGTKADKTSAGRQPLVQETAARAARRVEAPPESLPEELGDLFHLFYTKIWAVIQSSEKIAGDEDMEEIAKDLRQLYQNYFNDSHNRAQSLAPGFETNTQQHENPDRGKLRKLQHEAKDILPQFERGIYRYALFYMHLHRNLIQLRRDIEAQRRLYAASGVKTALKLSPSTGLLLRRAFREKLKLEAKKQKLLQARSLLQEIGDDFVQLKKALKKALGKTEAEQEITRLRGLLRQTEFDKAKEITLEWTKKSGILPIGTAGRQAAELGRAIIYAVRAHHKEMARDKVRGQAGNQAGQKGDILLDEKELGYFQSFLNADEQRMETFIQKFSYPYLADQYETLLKQAYKLGQMGTIESLLDLHARLLTGATSADSIAAHATYFEKNVLCRARYLVFERFTDFPALHDEMDMCVMRLRDHLGDIAGAGRP